MSGALPWWRRSTSRWSHILAAQALLVSLLCLMSPSAFAQCAITPALPGCNNSTTGTPIFPVPVVPLAFATATATAQAASQAGITGVETQLQGIRDRIQSRTPASSPLGFANDGVGAAGGWDALGYAAKSATGATSDGGPFFKATPKPSEPAPSYSIWGQGFGDRETRSGTVNGLDVGRNTTTFGGVGGIDVTIPRVGISEALVFGLLGGDTESHVRNADGSTAHVSGPGVGAYGMLVVGGFSADSVFKADFFGLDETAAGVTVPLHLVNLTSADNISYKFDRGSWWFEPTAGIAYTHTAWDAASLATGLTDGEQWRWQAGARAGTSFTWNGVNVTPTLTGLLYDDFSIRGGTIVSAVAPLVPTDEGRIFGQLIGRVNFDWSKNFSSYVEGEVRGRDNVLGVAGRVGLRYVFDTPR
jgi:outer membrane autotransporter protein